MCIMDAIRSNGGHAIHPTCWQPACVQRSGRVHCRIRMRRHESRHERVQGTPSLLKRAEVTQSRMTSCRTCPLAKKGGYLAALVADMLRVTRHRPPTDRDSS
jgi:hypothetical protein